MSITGAQVKIARNLLGWSQSKLEGRSGVSASAIARFEKGNSLLSAHDLFVVSRTLCGEGVEFTAENGARVKEPK